MIKYAMTAAILLAALPVHAKPATELFESVSNSIVVVYGKNSRGKAESLGSGVVLSTGEIVTNCHVIEKSVIFSVKHGNREYPAALKHADHDRDVCSLSVADLDAPAATLGGTKSLKVGQKVFAIGAPNGLELTLSEGIISSLREVKGGRYLQISAPISPGSSGGGLFDEDGRLVGLPTFYLAEGQQLNFAVPVEWVKELPQRQTVARKADRKAARTGLFWLNKAIELENQKDWPRLLRHAQSWVRAQPGIAIAWFCLGNAYSKSSQIANAVEAYQQALRINPEDANVWSDLGIAYKKSGHVDKAIEAYQQALQIDPTHVNAWFGLGNAYKDSGQTDKAIETFQQALRIKPEYAKAWNNLGDAYNNSDQPAKAIEAFRQALRVDPEYTDAWHNLGVVYGISGETPKGIDAFQQTLRIDPKHVGAWFNLGVAYQIEGQSSKVMEVYRRLKELDPVQADRFFNKVMLP